MTRAATIERCDFAPVPSAAATLSYDYEAQLVWIVSRHFDNHPMTHDLCAVHADRSTAPNGWELRDERPPLGISARTHPDRVLVAGL